MNPRPTAIVLGAGIMGLSTAWGLLRQGFAVHVLDQAPPPNPHGASVDHHRLIRHAYGARRGYMRMVDQAYAAWDALWADLGQVLHVQTGVLALDCNPGAEGAWMRESRAALRDAGYPFEELPEAALRARYPYLATDDVGAAFFCPQGGVLLAGRIVEALAKHLVARGVTFETGRAVALDPARSALTLEGGASRGADVLVVAAGPWAPKLLPGIAARVVASRQVVVRLAPPQDQRAAWESGPMLLDRLDESGFYLVPPVAGTPLKIGDHTFSRQGDPDEPSRAADPAEVARILGHARRRIPDLDRFEVLGAMNCFYDVEPEERFIIEPLGARGWVMSGFSGHGFKFGAVLGQRLARAIAHHEDATALTAWAAGEETQPA